MQMVYIITHSIQLANNTFHGINILNRIEYHFFNFQFLFILVFYPISETLCRSDTGGIKTVSCYPRGVGCTTLEYPPPKNMSGKYQMDTPGG